MVTRRIPPRLLPHRHAWAPLLGNTGDGDTWNTPVPVRCRFEPRTETVIALDGRTLTSMARVFLNPLPGDAQPQAGDQWHVGTRELRVLAVDTLVNIDGSTHHHELKVG